MIRTKREPIELAVKAVKSIKRFKGETLFSNDLDYEGINRIELPNPTMNFLFSDKYCGDNIGFAMGKIYNFWGQESSGKTAMAAIIAATIQKNGGHVLWIDAEGSFDNEYMYNTYGIDAENNDTFIVSVPNSIEDVTDIIDQFLNANAVDLIVVDSLTGLSTELILENEGNSNSMGAFARRVSDHLSRVTKKASKIDTSIIYINQARMVKKGQMFVLGSTGGNAIKFYAHAELMFTKTKNVESKDDDYKFEGHYTQIYLKKSKISFPQKKLELRFVPGEGFSVYYDYIQLAGKLGLLDISGSWYTLKRSDGTEIIKVQGMDKLATKLKEDPKIVEELYSNIKREYGCGEE